MNASNTRPLRLLFAQTSGSGQIVTWLYSGDFSKFARGELFGGDGYVGMVY
jgi:hypothetical protein